VESIKTEQWSGKQLIRVIKENITCSFWELKTVDIARELLDKISHYKPREST